MKKEEKYELKHHNDFHNIQFQHFNVKERNIILALCYKSMDLGTQLLNFNVHEIEELANYRPRAKGDNIYKMLGETYSSIKSATIRIDKKDGGIKEFVLFTTFETFPEEGRVEIRINEEYKYLINQVGSLYTRQALSEYSNLQSSYSQMTYSLLKRWESIKELKISIQDFRVELGVPESYRISEMDRRVFSLIKKELPQYFKNLNIEKMKTGREVTHLKFTWESDKKTLTEPKIIEVIISENLNKAIEKAKKNQYLSTLLTAKNIEKLTKEFEEKAIVKGLNHLYSTAKEPIKSLTYIKNAIKQVADTKTIKIVTAQKTSENIPPVIKKETITQSVATEQSQEKWEQQTFKTKVTQEEYDNLYREYLKNNKLQNIKSVRISYDAINKNKFEIIEKSLVEQVIESVPTTTEQKIIIIDEMEQYLHPNTKEDKKSELIKDLEKQLAEKKITVEQFLKVTQILGIE